MAVWAGFWIAITITNGWPAIYAIASGVSFGMFALAGRRVVGEPRAGARAEFRRHAGGRGERSLRSSTINFRLPGAGCSSCWGRRPSSLARDCSPGPQSGARISPIHRAADGSGLTVLFVGLVVWVSFKARDGLPKRSRNWNFASGVCASCSPLSRPANNRLESKESTPPAGVVF